MYRKPERIEIAVVLISIAVLLFAATYVSSARERPVIAGPRVAALLLLLLAALVLGQTFLARLSSRLTLLVAHCVFTLTLLVVLGARFVLVEIAVTLLLLLQVSLRLPAVGGVTVGVLVLVGQGVIGFICGSSLDERLLAFLPGAVTLFLAQAAIDYRERVVAVTSELESQRQSLENLAAANQSFVEHLEEVESDSAERERFRITRELHDSIGYAMTNIVMMMNASRFLATKDPDKLAEYCRRTKALASTTLKETREVLYKLRSVEKYRTKNARIFFKRLCRDFSNATSVPTECNAGNLPGAVSDRAFSILFRGLQVGLINAVRHAEAGRIKVFFWRDDAELRMTIWNSITGNPADIESAIEGIGLRGMRERLDDVRGALSYGRVTDGFQLMLTIPAEEL